VFLKFDPSVLDVQNIMAEKVVKIAAVRMLHTVSHQSRNGRHYILAGQAYGSVQKQRDLVQNFLPVTV